VASVDDEGIPLNRRSTVTKYEPMGRTTMARVKPRSFMMTPVGTAGAMSDFSVLAALGLDGSSWSRKVFSVEMMRWVAMMDFVVVVVWVIVRLCFFELPQLRCGLRDDCSRGLG
jgi:hypothetical protein